MARVLVTGSADGLGLALGRHLVDEGHEVVLHARSEARAADTRRAAPGAAEVLVADVETIAATRGLAEAAAALGRYDAVVHNVGLGYREAHRVTEDGLSRLWAVNVLAPYLLTALLPRPDRLVWLGSGMHRSGSPDLDDPQWEHRRWNGSQAYADTKLHDVLLALAVARRWPGTASNAVDPGWVPTRMGGPGAPDDLVEGHLTQAWLAVGDDPETHRGGGYYRQRRPTPLAPAARDEGRQERLLEICAEASGVALPPA